MKISVKFFSKFEVNGLKNVPYASVSWPYRPYNRALMRAWKGMKTLRLDPRTFRYMTNHLECLKLLKTSLR